MRTIDGVVTIVQESRFQLIDGRGVGHMVVLGHGSLAEPDQLKALAAEQALVRIEYTEPASVIGLLARSVSRL